ncbi:GNAT family N-acetyltransferase [Sphingomonas prati]|uniref:Ribosomal protein S18 acetylase RimI-like enzyme n=1 Tax=Sphingomonas prati TaxID=1843237 RepID=A0A7W9BRA1_9SPHN|nr:N-acetyltransferase [Sphingomonas prati]MBB5728516.1 ribosomal protein S18 acetylase RimI-like enzyme [Sphingomonas prati]GGE73185.1 N-acetyltransferase GCN5 [Sphingomonas prati]
MTYPPTALRPAVGDDRPALIDLLRRSWLRTWAPALPFDTVRVFVEQDPVTAYVSTHWAEFMVAARAGSIVGVLHVVGDCILSIEVDPRALRSGIGTDLLAHAEQQVGQSHGSARLEVRVFNRDALAFYRHHGWTEAERYTAMECGSPVETIALVKALDRRPTGFDAPSR